MLWWRDTPDGREIKIVLLEEEWVVMIEGSDGVFQGRELEGTLAAAFEIDASTPWLVALADQITAEASSVVR